MAYGSVLMIDCPVTFAGMFGVEHAVAGVVDTEPWRGTVPTLGVSVLDSLRSVKSHVGSFGCGGGVVNLRTLDGA